MSRVAIIHHHPIHYKHLLFSALHQQGLDFEVLYVAASSGNSIENRHLESAPYPYCVGFQRPYEEVQAWHAARFIFEGLTRIRPALVITSGYADPSAWSGWIWGELHRTPRIMWSSSNWFDRSRTPWKECLKRWFVSRCEAAHVYGTASREYLIRLGMPEERIVVKGAVANTALFLRPDTALPERPLRTLLYVGRFSKEKNLEFLIRTFSNFSRSGDHPQMILALVGFGPQETELRELSQCLGLDGLVQFWGRASQGELPNIYSKADAFILPSSNETWGLVVVEAMLSGLPVLVSNRCGCAADLVNGDTGWVFDPGRPDELAALLHMVSTAPGSELQRMGAIARAKAVQHTPASCARRVLDSIQQILARPAINDWPKS